jgi:perosamine synthetase
VISMTGFTLGPEVEESVLAVVRSGRLSQGPVVAALEEAFARSCGVRHAVAVNTGTAALVAALEALGLGPGDEVVVPAFTFVATANAVLATGADVHLVDVRPDDHTLDPDALAAAVGPRTRALVPVHLFGRPADLGAITPLANRHGLHLVEDAAQAHGARIGDRVVGGFGTGCFSFHATKNLAAGEGGMVTTDDDDVADRIRVLRNQGMRERYAYEAVGHNWRMTELAAAVLLPQLRHYPEQVARRRAHAARLDELLADVPGVVLPVSSPQRESVWHRYTVRLRDRDAVAAHLRACGIETGVHYPHPLQDHDCYRHHPRVHAGPTPVAAELARECLSLPVHPLLTDDDLTRIAGTLREAVTCRV